MPASRDWWTGVLFAVGSALFAVGAAPGYAGAVGARWDSVTFFVGSLFFTSAAYLSFLGAGGDRRSLGWWAAAVQLAGTLYFNVSTGTATSANLAAETANQHVWRPDAIGSACFLVASGLAWYQVCGGWTAWRPRSRSWGTALANLLGSVAFGVSAVAGYISPATGAVRNAERANLGTFVGAVCFFIGALLTLPAAPSRAGRSRGSRARRG